MLRARRVKKGTKGMWEHRESRVPKGREAIRASGVTRGKPDRRVPRENGAFRGPGESRAKWVHWAPKDLEERRGRLARRVPWVRKALEGYRGILASADPWGPQDSEVLPEKPVRWV